MNLVSQSLRNKFRQYGGYIFGRKTKIHVIPFGPIRGNKICIRFDYSPRMYFGIAEPWIARLAKLYIKPGDIIYDIGAHIGYTSVLFAKQLAGNGQIYAFEILPSISENYLKRTTEANNFKNITIINIGLSSTKKSMNLPIGSTGMTSIYSAPKNGQQFELCHTTTLDQYVREKKLLFPNLMKIDIEEAEVECLLGARSLIETSKPKMIIEFHTLALLNKGFNYLNALGYKMYLPSNILIDRHYLNKLEYFHHSVFCICVV